MGVREARPMTRMLLLPLSAPLILLLSGCGERESPHFVPATAATSKTPPADRDGPAKPAGEPAPMIKIEMH
jgi:hypothetical protein